MARASVNDIYDFIDGYNRLMNQVIIELEEFKKAMVDEIHKAQFCYMRDFSGFGEDSVIYSLKELTDRLDGMMQCKKEAQDILNLYGDSENAVL